MGAHNAHSQIERSGSDFFDTGTMAPTSPVFGFMGFLVLSSFALFHAILATCSSHTGMSCRLFSRWFGASSRHQRYPTVLAMESQLGIELLGYDPGSGLIFQGHFSCSRKLPRAFLFFLWADILYSLLRGHSLAQVDVAGMYKYVKCSLNMTPYFLMISPSMMLKDLLKGYTLVQRRPCDRSKILKTPRRQRRAANISTMEKAGVLVAPVGGSSRGTINVDLGFMY